MTDDQTPAAPQQGRGIFFRVRVGLLLVVLALVLVYAWHDVTERRERTTWDRTLDVAVVIVERDPVDPHAVEMLRARLPSLADRLSTEMHRYRPSAPAPFAFHFFGPVTGSVDPPVPEGDGVLDLARHAWRTKRYVADIDRDAAVPSAAYDSRIYVTVRRPVHEGRTLVEGLSEEGGRVGLVSVELDDGMVDLSLAVVAHELLHTLGATDKYDPQGHVLVPDGLAEPTKDPLYPQQFVEIMARTRPIAPGQEQIPDTLDDLAVGPATAREIGWSL